MIKRLKATVFPEAVKAQAFGSDVKKFIDFVPNTKQEIDQYTSDIIFGDVILENSSGKVLRESVFVKVQPEREFITSTFDVDAHMHNEVLFYAEIAPSFRKYDTENFLSRNVPEFIYGKATNGVNPKADVVVMKNLSEKGFRMTDERLFLDEKHISLALDRLAKYHALSFKCLHDDPQGFRRLASKIQARSLKSGSRDTKVPWDRLKFRGIEPLKNDPEYKDRLGDISTHCEHATAWVNSCKEASGPLSIIARGDLTRNNLMFKYDSDGQPEEVVFVDFACIRRTSLVIDIGVLLTLNTSPEAKRLHWDDYIGTYYSALSRQLDGYTTKPSFADLELEIRKKGVHGYHWSAFLLPATLETDAKERLESLDPEARMRYMMEFGGPKATEYLTEIVKHMLDRNYIFE